MYILSLFSHHFNAHIHVSVSLQFTGISIFLDEWGWVGPYPKQLRLLELFQTYNASKSIFTQTNS